MILEIKNWHVWFGSHHVLKDINLTFPSKGIVAILGPSGCGKTTLLRSLNRTAELEASFRYQGSILFKGENIYAYRDPGIIRKRIGMVFQNPIALPLSIKENVLFGPRYWGMDKVSPHELCERILKRVGLWEEVKDRLHRSAQELSGGQKQRLALARVLALEPEILLLDEPCSSLDPDSTQRIEVLLKDLAQEKAVIMVTHNIDQAHRLADRVILMREGKVIEKP